MQSLSISTRIAFALIAVGPWAVSTVEHSCLFAEEEASVTSTPLEPIVIGSPDRIDVYPASFQLRGQRSYQHLIVTGHYADGRIQDLTRAARFTSDQPDVVQIEGLLATPRSDGRASISVEVGGHTKTVAAEVIAQKAAHPVSLQFDVLAALTKQGCNGGACHGSPSGKGGFRLSLLGYDPELDQHTLIRETYGRRTNPFQPDESLLLTKPMMQIAHGGGLRLRKTDPAYEVLRGWIHEGGRTDPSDAPTCQKVEVYPPRQVLAWPAHTQQMVVLAHFSDGSVRDVTRLASYSSSDATVATVRPSGLVVSGQRGETAVVVRYLEHVETASLTFLRNVEGFEWNNPPQFNEIDRFVDEKLKLLQIPTSPLCADSDFVRRVHLDLLGQLPEAEEVESFLADKRPNKRTELIDRLLKRHEFAEYWALKWGDLLRIKSSKVTTAGVHKFHRWLVEAVGSNMPYDKFTAALLTAQGSTLNNPPANYYRTAASVNDCAETTSQMFLGIRIQCAKCHNHPFERWTQNNYYGIGAFFNRVRRKETNVQDEMVVWVAKSGEVMHPKTDQPVRPWLPGAGQIDIPGEGDRRHVFAKLLTSPENPLFAQVGVNRIWGHLMGRGIVEPVDDFRESNPASSQPLLNALAADFVRSGFDQKHIIRKILNSRTYQLSSQSHPLNEQDEKYFSHARSRMLGAEQLLDAICRVTGVQEKFRGLPSGTRATQMPSPDASNEFLKVFGQPARESACECERQTTPKLTQALQLCSGPLLQKKLRDPRGRLARLLDDAAARLASSGKPPENHLVLWLRADAGALGPEQRPVEDGQLVAQWQDYSGTQRLVSQDDKERRPVYLTNGIGGLPALRFDGKNDLLHHTSENLLESGTPRTIMMVARADAQSEGGVLFAFRRSTAGGKTIFGVQQGRVAGHHYVYSDGVHAAGNSTVPANTLATLKEPFVTTFFSSGAGQKLKVSVNGKPLQVSQSGAVGTDNGETGFTVGSREDLAAGSPGYSWPGEIAEILVYDRVLEAKQLAAAGGYLASKYGLETEYPAVAKPKVVTPVVQGKSNREIITQWYLTALARHPTAEEIEISETYIKETGDRRQGLEDICWAVLNSKEFLFQH